MLRNYNSTPPRYPPRFRTLLGLIKPYIVLISCLNPGGVILGGVPLESLKMSHEHADVISLQLVMCKWGVPSGVN